MTPKNRSRLLLTLIAASAAAACSGSGPGEPAPSGDSLEASQTPHSFIGADGRKVTITVMGAYKDLCAAPPPGEASCHVKVKSDILGRTFPMQKLKPGTVLKPATTPTIPYRPADLVSAYNITTVGAGTPVIAIVDAQDDPNAFADMNYYRTTFSLASLPTCTSSGPPWTPAPCFKKMDQNGGSSYPTGDMSWGGEISLDLDMASAACPGCTILLFEASSASQANLGTAVNTAASLGASVISNSYGAAESASNSTFDTQYYHHDGTTIFASAGDDGYEVQYPAAGAWVIGVGGTNLQYTGTGRNWAETVWGTGTPGDGTGAGCSQYTTTPLWETTVPAPGCPHKMVADMSALADPNTGVFVYDSYEPFGTGSGQCEPPACFWQYGGTSLASPLSAAIFARANLGGVSPGFVWDHTSAFYDVTAGQDPGTGGTLCSAPDQFWCNGEVGYDGPTGWGTPNGAAFAALPQFLPPIR